MSSAIISPEQASLLEDKGLKVKFEVCRRQQGPDRGKETISDSVYVARLVSADDDSEMARGTGETEQIALDEAMKSAATLRRKATRAELESELSAMRTKLDEVTAPTPDSSVANPEPPKRPPGRPRKSDD